MFPAGVPNSCLKGLTVDCTIEAELLLPAGDVGSSAAAWMLVITSLKHWSWSSISGMTSPSSSSSKVSLGGLLGNDGDSKSAANAIMPAFGLSGVLRLCDGCLASLPMDLVVIVLALSLDSGVKIELPSVSSRLDR